MACYRVFTGAALAQTRDGRKRRVVEYREGLQLAWEDTSASRSLAQLRDWCRRAEASGIGALSEFARGLPAYASVRA